MATKKREKFTTPKGEAVYPYLNKPDDKEFDGKPQKPAFKTGLKLSAEDAAPHIERLDAAIDAAFEETKAMLEERLTDAKGKKLAETKKKLKELEKAHPYEPDYDDNGDPTDDVVIRFKQNAEIKKKNGEITKVKLPLFDAKGKPTTVMIWGGSIIKVSYSLRPYYMESTNKVGVSVDLGAVQVIEPVNGSGGNAENYGFGEEEGYEDEGDDDTPGSEFNDESGDDGAEGEEDF